MANRFSVVFKLSINGGDFQSLEGGGTVESWADLKSHLTNQISMLIDMNEGMGLKDWNYD